MEFIIDTLLDRALELGVAWFLSTLVVSARRITERIFGYLDDRHVDLTMYLTFKKEVRIASSILLVMFGVIGATTYGFAQENYVLALVAIYGYFLSVIGLLTVHEASQLSKWDRSLDVHLKQR